MLYLNRRFVPMMRRRKRNKKWLLWIMVLIFIVIASVIIILVWNNYFRDKEIPSQVDTEQVVVDVNNDIQEETIDNEGEYDEPKVVQYEGDNPNLNNTLTGAVTYVAVNNATLNIRINIDQYLNEGKCSLAILNDNNEIYSEEANIVGSVATSTCEGFDVPVSELGNGKFELRIVLRSSDKTGIISGEVNI